MKNALLSESSSKTENRAFFSFLINFLIKPIKSGFYGFTAFFVVLVLAKSILYFFGFSHEFIVNSEDVLFCLLGLIIVFPVKLVESIKNQQSHT